MHLLTDSRREYQLHSYAQVGQCRPTIQARAKAVTDGTSKIICATQTVHQENTYMKVNEQMTLENMLPNRAHAFQGRLETNRQT